MRKVLLSGIIALAGTGGALVSMAPSSAASASPAAAKKTCSAGYHYSPKSGFCVLNGNGVKKAAKKKAARKAA